MILAKLREYTFTQMQLPPEMYTATPVRWYISLSAKGELEEFVPLGGDSKANKRGESLLVPNLVRASNIRPKLLADNGEYVLGIADTKKAGDPVKVAERHRQFTELVKLCAASTHEPTLQAVLTFLGNWTPDPNQLPKGFEAGDTLTFRVFDEQRYVIPAIELESVQRFWAKYTAGENDSEAIKTVMQCLVTGNETVVEARMPGKIKGIPDGQTAGTSLVSANAQAFTSYGLENSLTSPISRDAAERFTKALNQLISNKQSRLYVENTVYVFWTRNVTEFDPVSYLDAPDPGLVKKLYESPRSGSPVYQVGSDDFYALALSASGGRAVVRSWLHTTIPNAEDNLRYWFDSQRIVDAYGEVARPLKVYVLASACYRDASKEMRSSTSTALIRTALAKAPLPNDLLIKVVQRCKVGTTNLGNDRRDFVTYSQAALIKLILTTQGVAMSESLDTNLKLNSNDQLAYQCGRLLAELEAIQQAAQGRINATLVDRFYGAASSTPNSAFAPLLTNVRAHLSKLRKTKTGTWQAKEQVLEDILSYFKQASNVAKLPATLTVKQQGIFALGFYHQRAYNRAEAKAAKDSKVKDNQGDK
jgi:CRISPR-associated protein Csd1